MWCNGGTMGFWAWTMMIVFWGLGGKRGGDPREALRRGRDRPRGIRGAAPASGDAAMRADGATVGFRLRSAQGHLDGVIRMVEEDRYCIDVLHQLSAVQGGIERIRRDVLDEHPRGGGP